jgi:hypothetical protein
VFFHPSVYSFDQILADPQMSASRPFLWIAIIWVTASVVSVISGSAQAQEYGTINSWGLLILLLVIEPLYGVINLVVGCGINHVIACLLGGSGTYTRMLYAYGSVQAPTILVASVLSIPLGLAVGLGSQNEGFGFLSLCIIPFTLGLSVYSFYLRVMAIMAAEKMDGWRSFLTTILPGVIIFTIAIILIILIMIFRNTQ